MGTNTTQHNWEHEWVDMPTFHVPTRDTVKRNQIDISDVWELANRTTSIHPKYPIYIISKGRWTSPLTANSLDRMGIE
jgi:hypothetical protein